MALTNRRLPNASPKQPGSVPEAKCETKSKNSLAAWIHRAWIYALFGLFLQKGQVYQPAVIRGQFLLDDWRMMCMFLSAVGGTHFLLGSLVALSSCRSLLKQVHGNCQKGHGERGWVAVALGAGILGVGMALAGACPGTIQAQLGSHLYGLQYDASYQLHQVGMVLLGALVGGLLFLWLRKPFLLDWVFELGRSGDNGISLHLVTGVSFSKLTAGMAAMEFIMIAVICQFLPISHPQSFINWDYLMDVSQGSLLQKMGELLNQPVWHPVYSGLGIGLLQVPSVILLHHPLGSSSNLVAIWGLLGLVVPGARYLIPAQQKEVPRPPATIYTALSKSTNVTSSVNWSKIFSVFASILGAYGSIRWWTDHSSPLGIPSIDVDQWTAFLGGFCLVFGARLAGGCTSGHGISGMGMLIWNSVVVAVPSMFLCAILTAQVLFR